MKIRKAPYPIDFLGNSPEFILSATPFRTAGRRWKGVYSIHALPEGTLTVRIDGEELTWTLAGDPGDGLWEMMTASTPEGMLDSLEAKLIYNPQLNREFAASAKIVTDPSLTGGAPTVHLTLTAREPGPHSVRVFHLDPGATQANENIWVTGGGITGQSRTPRKDWRVMAFFSITTPQGVSTTPEMIFEESGGDVHVSAEILRAYMPKPDIPGWGVYFGAEHCPNATAKARLYYGELYADETLQAVALSPVAGAATAADRPQATAARTTPYLRTLSRSDEITLVNGELQERSFLNNIPDWEDPSDTHFHLRTGTGIFGQDDNGTVLTPRDTEQYIYMYNFGNTVTAARVQAAAVFADGTGDDDWADENLALRPGVNRVTVRIDDPEVTALRVNVWVGDTVKATRGYVVKACEHGFHTFLMLNALNLYETFIVEELAREESTEGERRIVAGRDSYGTTDRQTVFTARCHPRNARGLRLLRTAFAKQDNLLLEGKFAWRIDMLPGSLTVSDEGNDLTECEFKFRLREKVNRDPQVFNVTSEVDAAAQVAAGDTVLR